MPFQTSALSLFSIFPPYKTSQTVKVSAKLKDEVCPPQFAVYNNLSCQKKQYFYPDFGHEDLLSFTDLSCLFLQNCLSV